MTLTLFAGRFGSNLERPPHGFQPPVASMTPVSGKAAYDGEAFDSCEAILQFS